MPKKSPCSLEMINHLCWLLNNAPDSAENSQSRYEDMAEKSQILLLQLTQYLLGHHVKGTKLANQRDLLTKQLQEMLRTMDSSNT